MPGVLSSPILDVASHLRERCRVLLFTLSVKSPWFMTSTCDAATTKSKQKRLVVAVCNIDNKLAWCPVQAVNLAAERLGSGAADWQLWQGGLGGGAARRRSGWVAGRTGGSVAGWRGGWLGGGRGPKQIAFLNLKQKN